MIALRCSDLSCRRTEWTHGPSQVDGLSLDFQEGFLHLICGEPGSGRTLLLHLLSLLERPDTGSVEVFDQSTSELDDGTRCEFRNAVFGYLFANPCLLPAFTVAENVAMPLFRFFQADAKEARKRIAEILERLGIEDSAGCLAGNLSQAEQQLVALARAIVHRPRILIAISPAQNATLLPHVRQIVSELGITCLWSDRTDAIAPQCDRTLVLQDGRLVADRLCFS